ncbi:hypothetical protein JDV02_004179 [Purpureocillium takamizusanense]|uniref:Uncharacterized protein n=1 Tax=Purpureocillium takamizusanense TaxID=2060973 RepID=A0A9Q8QDY2_9HYPO|nr:uncharacterized protein JDV02_004179 [Purpureocillium takamizusanense]UNI17865.1 hypothetical protein JDV02_004179 [Purpureocillium takamizusanense]
MSCSACSVKASMGSIPGCHCEERVSGADKAAESSARLADWVNDRSEPRTVVLGAEGFQGWSYWKPPVPGQGSGSGIGGWAAAVETTPEPAAQK